MEKQKTDVRSRYTQGVIKTAFLEQLKVKPIRSITVAELCAMAKINRGTFYNHFYDINDVYESIENELFDTILSKLNQIKVDSFNYTFFIDITKIIADSKTLVRSILANMESNHIFKKIIAFAKDKYVQIFQNVNINLKKDTIDQVFTYILHGSIGIISEWIKNDNTDNYDDVASQINFFNNLLLNTLLKR